MINFPLVLKSRPLEDVSKSCIFVDRGRVIAYVETNDGFCSSIALSPHDMDRIGLTADDLERLGIG